MFIFQGVFPPYYAHLFLTNKMNLTQIIQDTSIFIQMAVYYFIITNVRYGTTTSDTTCTRINNDCSGWTTWLYRYKKEEKSRSPRHRLNTNNAFVIPPFLENITYLTYLDWGAWNPGEPPVNYSQTRLKWHQGAEDLSLLNVAGECRPSFQGRTHHHRLGGRQERRNACRVFRRGQLSWSPCHL